MSYHALSYKHRCKGSPDAKRRRRLQQLDVRIEQRLGAGGKLEQQAGGEDLEQRAWEEDIEQRAGEEDLEQRAGEEDLKQQAREEAAALEEEVVGLAAVAQA